MRVETGAGLSVYSNEVTATTLALPLPPAPSLQGTAPSSSQIHLSWTTTATGIIRFRLERRTTSGAYSEITQPSAFSTSFDDSSLTASTGYVYRMRVETGAGISPYSNEVTVTTLQALPAAPTNLQATASSSSQVNLIWTNNAPEATVIRVESQSTASTSFTDIGAAPTLTSSAIGNLQAGTTYGFRVRAQNAAGYSPYSNVATATTLSNPKTVFLIHGIGQGSWDLQGLFNSLIGPLGVDRTRFGVNAGFDFSECADTPLCSTNCSISLGAQKLAQYIISAKPPGDIVLVGFSMGGLIARDMIANNWFGVLNGHRVAALITLGTPNAGYPYTVADTVFKCASLVQEMDGNWRSQQATNSVVLSQTYLLPLTNRWAASGFPGGSGVWLAASGRQCSNPIRNLNLGAPTGCRDSNKYSDGVVCNDSAIYNLSTPVGTSPSVLWQDPSQMYVHTNAAWGLGASFVLCGNSGNPTINPPLSDPPPGPLLSQITGVINALR
jgi:pimeloyl-ACP methyl ester carboxylesterase